MLNNAITRLNTIEAAQQMLGSNMDTLDGKVNKLGANSAAMLEKVNGEDIKRDGDLRRELD